MTTETEAVIRFETDQKKLQSRRALVGNVIAWLAFIAFLVGLFFVLKLNVEIGLKLISHEITEHVRINRGLVAESIFP